MFEIHIKSTTRLSWATGLKGFSLLSRAILGGKVFTWIPVVISTKTMQ